MNFNLPFFSTLISSLLVLILGLFVLKKAKGSQINKIFFFFCTTIFVWLFSYSLAYLSDQKITSLFFFKIGYLGVIFIPIVWYHFEMCFLGNQNRKLSRLVFWGYLCALFFGTIVFTQKWFIVDLFTYPWGYYPKVFIPSHLLFLLYFNFYFTAALLIMFFSFWKRKDISPHEATKRKYIFFSGLIGTFAAIDFLPNYGINVTLNTSPFGFTFMIAFCLITAYAIFRHQLMEIEVIIKKTVVFAGMFAFAFGIFVAMTLLISQFIAGGNSLLAFAISAFIIVFTLRPTETWLINATDKFLFQKKYEYKQIIKAFIDNVVTELNLDTVIRSTLKLLDETLHPYTCAVFILNKIQDKYQLYDSLGFESKDLAFTAESKLIIFLKNRQLPAVIRQVNGIAGVNPAIAAEMSSLKATIVLPLMLHSDLIGFISVGKKKSDEDYSKDDLDVLQDLARTESIAVANAQLLTEAAQAERRAAIGTMAAGINHEIGNPLNIINTKIQVFRTAVQRGFYKDKPKEEIMEECVAILDETIKQTERIAEITKKLSNFAKPGKEFKPVIISIPQEIENTLGILGHDLELERIKIIKEISTDPNKILADEHETQQILFNIIRNAGQSIERAGTITIRAFITPAGKVRIEIQDTGKGISEDKIHRVFEPFFTTKGTKGTGLGLSIVRQLVWKNKGEISFKSKVGVGTTFVLEFPKAE